MIDPNIQILEGDKIKGVAFVVSSFRLVEKYPLFRAIGTALANFINHLSGTNWSGPSPGRNPYRVTGKAEGIFFW